MRGANLRFKIDLPEEGPHRLDRLYDIKDPSQIKIYDPATHRIDPQEANHFAICLPAKSVIFHLYASREQSGEYGIKAKLHKLTEIG